MNKSKHEGKSNPGSKLRPAQRQRKQPGRESIMRPLPVPFNAFIKGSHKLAGKTALITGGDSGIGKACAMAFAREGADVAIVYLNENEDANETRLEIETEFKRSCLLLRGDVAKESFCRKCVAQTAEKFGRLDILVNNAAEQHPQKSILDISAVQLQRTFQTNLYSMFYFVKASLPHLLKQNNPTIINTASVTAYRGSPGLLDYSASKGAIVSFTRSLSLQLVKKGVRVNGVAPGPIWTPLIPSTFPAREVKTFGSDTPLGRAGEPWECAECYVFLASLDSSYMNGQILHPNGGEIING